MKSISKVVWGGVAGLLALGWAPGVKADEAFTWPEPVGVQSEQLFAPPGFDSNDIAQIVVHGHYMNSCYRWAQPRVTFDRSQRLISISPQAYLRESSWCAPVRVQYTQPIELGVLAPGKYRVVEFDARGRLLHETGLTIAASEATSPDDFLYAPIKNARVVQTGAGRELVLSGTFPSDCMELQEIKTLHRAHHVIEVLPIVSFKAGTGCGNNRERPFEARVKVPATEAGETLLHVRLLNGQAINLVEQF